MHVCRCTASKLLMISMLGQVWSAPAEEQRDAGSVGNRYLRSHPLSGTAYCVYPSLLVHSVEQSPYLCVTYMWPVVIAYVLFLSSEP